MADSAKGKKKADGRGLETRNLQEALSALRGEDGRGDVVVLNMFGAHIGVEGAKAIGEALKSNRTLASLNLGWNHIGAEGAKAIGETLESNETLTSMDLFRNQIGAEGAKAIGEALKVNGTLTGLNLRWNKIGDEGAKAIAETLKSNGTLTSLYLGGNQIGGKGAEAIGEALKSNGTLTSLYLVDNQIGDEGAKAIGEALKSNGTLTSLYLDENQIGAEGAKAIGEALKSNGTLTGLDLRGNQIDAEGAIALFCSLEHRASSSCADGEELKWDLGKKVTANSKSLRTPTPALDMIKRLIENGKGSFAVNISNKLGTGALKAFAKGWHQLKQKGIALLLPPESVISRGAKNIRSFFNELSSGGLSKDRRQKMIIVGDASAGKTSLLESLRNGKPFLTPPGPDRATVGVKIDVWKLYLEQSTTSVANDEQSGDLLVYTHDFGGQNQYLVTHTLFLSQRATIVLVFNIKDFPNNKKKREVALRKHILFWLYKARSRAPGATFILVATHCGEQRFGFQTLAARVERKKCEQVRFCLLEELEKDRAQLEQKKVDLESQVSAVERDIERSQFRFKATMRNLHIQETLESVKFQLSARPTVSEKVFRTSSSTGYGLKEVEKEIVSWVHEDASQLPLIYVELSKALSRKAEEMTSPSTDTKPGVAASAESEVESPHSRSPSKLPVFSFSEVEEIFAQEVGGEMRPEDLERALEYLHDFGSIIYHQPSTGTGSGAGSGAGSGSGTGADDKESFIFPDPTALVDALSKLVRHDMVVGHEGGEPYLQRIIREANKQVSDPSQRWNEKHIIEQVRRYNLLPMELLKHFELWKKVWESGANYFYAMLDLVQDLDFTFISKGSDGTEYIFLYYPMEKLSGAEISDMNSKIAEIKQGNKAIGDWRYQFPSFIPSGLFQRLLARFHSLNPRQDPEHDFVVFSGKQKLFSKMQFVTSTLDSASTSSSSDDKIMIEVEVIDNSVSSSATADAAGTTSRKELIIRLYVSNEAAVAMAQHPQSNAHRTREAWELFRNHARSVESIFAETPGLEVNRLAIYSPEASEESISFTMEECERIRSTRVNEISTQPPNPRVDISLDSLIGPPTSAALVPRPNAVTYLPRDFVNHILLVGSKENGSQEIQLLANEFRFRGFVVDIAKSASQVRGQVKASFCIVGFLTKGVLQTELFQFVLAEGMSRGRNFSFFFEKEQGPSKFEFSELGECSETIRPMVHRCQSKVDFTAFQRDRVLLRAVIDKVTEPLLLRVDSTLFREVEDLLNGARRHRRNNSQPSGVTRNGPIAYLSQNDFELSTWRQCESWLDLSLPEQEGYARNPMESREFLVETIHPLPSDDLAFHGFMSHYQGTGGGQCHVLFTELERRGLKIWYDMNQQDRNSDGMAEGVNRSAWYLLFLSKDVFTRDFVLFELVCALAAEKPIILMYEDEIASEKFDFSTWGTVSPSSGSSAETLASQEDGTILTKEVLVEMKIADAQFADVILGILNSLRIGSCDSLYTWAKSKDEQTIAKTTGKGEYATEEIGEGPASGIRKFVESYTDNQQIIPDEVKFLLPDLLQVKPCYKRSELISSEFTAESKCDELKSCILAHPEPGSKLDVDQNSEEWKSLRKYVEKKVGGIPSSTHS